MFQLNFSVSSAMDLSLVISVPVVPQFALQKTVWQWTGRKRRPEDRLGLFKASPERTSSTDPFSHFWPHYELIKELACWLVQNPHRLVFPTNPVNWEPNPQCYGDTSCLNLKVFLLMWILIPKNGFFMTLQRLCFHISLHRDSIFQSVNWRWAFSAQLKLAFKDLMSFSH